MESGLNNVTLSLNTSGTAMVFPHYITIVRLISNLVGPPVVIIPAVMVIMVIVKDEQLRTNNRNVFIVNLLVADICYAARQFFLNGGNILLYLVGQSLIVNCGVVNVLSYFTAFANNLMFLPLSIDRLINVAFPFSYKRIVTFKVVMAVISFLWVAALLLSILVSVNQPTESIPALGTCKVLSTIILPLAAILPMLIFIVLITATCIYLCYKIIKVNRFFHGIDRKKSNRAGQLVEILQEQLKPTISVFIVGGIDALFNLLFISLVVLRAFLPVNLQFYIVQLVGVPLQLCQAAAHPLAYGFYEKDIEEKIFTCDRPCTKRSKVIVLNRQ